MSYDGVVLGLGLFQELHSGVAHRFVFVQFAVAKQQRHHGVDNQQVGSGIAQMFRFGICRAVTLWQPLIEPPMRFPIFRCRHVKQCLDLNRVFRLANFGELTAILVIQLCDLCQTDGRKI